MLIPEECSKLLDGRLAAAVELARMAGQSTLELFCSSGLDVERKGDDSPVTLADKRAEQLIRGELAKRFADDSILGEEFGVTSGSSKYGWIVDPIDGTKSFISGVPLYSTLVAVIEEQRAVAGVIYIPALDEMVFAAAGGGCWHSRGGNSAVRSRVSSRTLNQGLFVLTQVDSFTTHGAEEAYRALEREAYVTRSWGDGYGYLLVATGRAELMVDPIANPWDLAAVQVVVDEAGGSFTDWHGKATYAGGQGLATNGLVHPLALKHLGPVARVDS